jgi:hypothetical protein
MLDDEHEPDARAIERSVLPDGRIIHVEAID